MRAEPVVFGAGCFGWFHPARASRAVGRAVVLCGPHGQEAAWTHRGWRDLAEMLAEAGLPALRFDWPGTGDSAGEEAPEQIRRWVEALYAAGGWLRAHSGAKELALCGLRLGAAVAALAAARRPGEHAALALLAPVLSGRDYLRQLMLASVTGADAQAAPAPGEWLEAGGHRLHRSDLELIGRFELAPSLALARVPRLLLLEAPSHKPLPDSMLRMLQLAGSDLQQLPFEGLGGFLRDAHLSETPASAFTEVTAWLGEDAPPAVRAAAPPSTPVLALGSAAETPHRFGPGGSLFGILCTPASRTRSAPPAVLMLNTGAIPRSGHGRMAVVLARRLAALGVASLRMDMLGAGDAAAAPCGTDTASEGWMFRPEGVQEVRAALDLLEAQGHPRVVVLGICSGAHHAFQAALRDPRIVGLTLANLPAFDRAAGGAPALDGGPPPGEHRLLHRPRMLMRRILAELDFWAAEGLGIESRLNRPGRWMRELSVRGVSVLLAYSARDRGLRELRAHFGRGGRRLADLTLVRRITLPGTDHSLTPRIMRDAFMALVLEEMARHHGAPDATPRPVRTAVGATSTMPALRTA